MASLLNLTEFDPAHMANVTEQQPTTNPQPAILLIKLTSARAMAQAPEQ